MISYTSAPPLGPWWPVSGRPLPFINYQIAFKQKLNTPISNTDCFLASIVQFSLPKNPKQATCLSQVLPPYCDLPSRIFQLFDCALLSDYVQLPVSYLPYSTKGAY
jgi:hypothetical protein